MGGGTTGVVESTESEVDTTETAAEPSTADSADAKAISNLEELVGADIDSDNSGADQATDDIDEDDGDEEVKDSDADDEEDAGADVDEEPED